MTGPVHRSVITLRNLNADPLPPPEPGFTAMSYGTVVGGDDALDSKDEDASHIEYLPAYGGASSVVTCRAVATPPFPPSAIAVGTDTFLTQTRLESLTSYDVRPTFLLMRIRPDAPGFFPGGFIIGGPFDPRNITQPPYGTSWWDETDGNSDGDGPGFYGSNAPGTIEAVLAGDYFIICGGNGADQGTVTHVSQLTFAVLWTLPQEPYLRMNQRDDGLGISGHPRLHGPNGPSSRQLSRPPRIGGSNLYE